MTDVWKRTALLSLRPVEDPDETHNLAYQPEMRDLLKKFRQSMMDSEGRLNRRRMTAQRPAAQLLNWGKLQDYGGCYVCI